MSNDPRNGHEEIDAIELLHSTSTPLERITGDMDSEEKRIFAWRWSLIVACLILGIVVSLLIKTYRREGTLPTLYTQREDLAKMVKYLETERNKLQADLNQARDTIRTFEKGTQEDSALRKQLETYKQEAGLTPLQGPGIIITLSDSPIKPREGDDPNFYIVHDIDLQTLVNELWGSGAEAVSINDQRLVMTSAIRCVGPTITVNTVRLSPPYLIKAIGPAQTLEMGLKYAGGFLDSMSPNMERGVKITLRKDNNIKVPAYRGSLVNRYANPYRGHE